MFQLTTSLVAQLVKNLPAMQETWVQSLGWEDPLEEGMTTHSSILAWEIPWTEDPGRAQSMGVSNSRTRLSNSSHVVGSPGNQPPSLDGVQTYPINTLT